jgi:vacuolar-type H+-ATPase catalytic subunit A/Vma1
MNKMKPNSSNAIISRISGSVVVATGIEEAQMFDVVRIGELGLLGEIIRLEGTKATIHAFFLSQVCDDYCKQFHT